MTPNPSGLPFQVQRVTSDAVVLPNGQIQRIRRVYYTVGNHGPFTLEVPETDFTADLVQKLLTQQAQQIAAVGALGGS